MAHKKDIYEPSTSTEYGFYKKGETLYIIINKTGDNNKIIHALEWIFNLLYIPVVTNEGCIHLAGFLKWISIRDKIISKINKENPMRIVFVGYSQGAATALIAHNYLCDKYNIPMHSVVFGAPHWISTKKRLNAIRVEYGNDAVTKNIPHVGFKPVGYIQRIGPKRVWWKISPSDHSAYYKYYD